MHGLSRVIFTDIRCKNMIFKEHYGCPDESLRPVSPVTGLVKPPGNAETDLICLFLSVFLSNQFPVWLRAI
jgi:hypothetical protein